VLYDKLKPFKERVATDVEQRKPAEDSDQG
jgi:hypothetical protein